MFALSRWRVGHLMMGWCAYWIVLILTFLGPAIPVLWRVTRPDAHGSVSAAFGDGALSFIISEGTAPVWTHKVGILPAMLAIGVPPLVLWALWLRSQRRHTTVREVAE